MFAFCAVADLHEDDLMKTAALDFLVSKDCQPVVSLAGYETLTCDQYKMIIDVYYKNLQSRN